jgi:hypothetical protein
MWCNYGMAHQKVRNNYGNVSIGPELHAFVINNRHDLQHHEDLRRDGQFYVGKMGWLSKDLGLIKTLGSTVESVIQSQDEFDPKLYMPDIHTSNLNVKHGSRQLHVLTIVGYLDSKIDPIPHYNFIVGATKIALENLTPPIQLPTQP